MDSPLNIQTHQSDACTDSSKGGHIWAYRGARTVGSKERELDKQSSSHYDPSSYYSSEGFLCNTHWENWKGRESNLAWVTGKHGNWAQGQGQRSRAESHSASHSMSTSKRIQQMWESDHCTILAGSAVKSSLGKSQKRWKKKTFQPKWSVLTEAIPTRKSRTVDAQTLLPPPGPRPPFPTQPGAA